MKLRWSMVVMALVIPGIRVWGQDAGDMAGAIGVAWNSHYISEGRKNIGNNGLVSSMADTALELPAGEMIFGAWYASAYDVDYAEMNLSAGWSLGFADIEMAVAYTYLDFLSDDADDHELGIDLRYTAFGWVDPFVTAYYSFDEEGTFMELGLGRTFVWNRRWTLDIYTVLGINEGYVPEGHDGLNHAAAGIDLSLLLREHLSLTCSIAYTAAIDKNEETYAEDESLTNLFYGGVGLTARF